MIWAIIGNLLLSVLKYWAGITTGSLALVADAWHSLSDIITSAIVLIGGKISRKPADEEHPFGHGRAEHIASVIIGVLLAIVAFDFVIGGIEKFGDQEKTHYSTFAWIAVIVSIAANEAMTQYAFLGARKTGSGMLKADGWHHRSDAIASFMIVGGIYAGRYFWWVDGVLGIIVATLIFYATFDILQQSIFI